MAAAAAAAPSSINNVAAEERCSLHAICRRTADRQSVCTKKRHAPSDGDQDTDNISSLEQPKWDGSKHSLPSFLTALRRWLPKIDPRYRRLVEYRLVVNEWTLLSTHAAFHSITSTGSSPALSSRRAHSSHHSSLHTTTWRDFVRSTQSRAPLIPRNSYCN